MLEDGNEATREIPECRILSDLIDECIIFNCSSYLTKNEIKKVSKNSEFLKI